MTTQTSDFEGLEADIFRARASSYALKNLLSDRSQVYLWVSLSVFRSRETSLARVSPCERKSERERKCVRDG